MKKAHIELNSNNLLFNYEYYKKETKKKIIAVIKDNAYGHGVEQITKILNETDVSTYAVANINEAIEASIYTLKDILILDKVDDYEKVTPQMIITVISMEHLKEIIASNLELRVHIKINTGMNRKGILQEEFEICKKMIEESSNVHLEGVYTHYSSNKKNHLEEQFAIFRMVTKNLSRKQYLIHASSSVSSLLFKENLTNSCRIGIGLYGLNHKFKVMEKVKPVLSLYSSVDRCMPVLKNTKVGYDYLFKTPNKGYLILSPVGYSFGYLIKKKYLAFYKGEYLKQMCRVCMDCCIYFSNRPIKEGEKLELLGEHVRVDDIVKNNNCSPYETVTLLNKNIKRIII